MSINVITWVMSHADVQNHGELAVLYALAERAHEDGRYAWPSQSWIAYRARCTTRTVRNHLANLESRGMIRRGDQNVVSHLDARYRPIVWDIDMAKVRSDPEPAKLSALARSRAESFSARPENPDTQGGKSEHPDRKPVSYKPSIEPSSEPSKNLTPSSPPPGDRFDEFWSLVPRKAGIGKARTAYRNAVKRAGDEQTVIDGMRRFANDPNLPAEKQYIPHPATWLNGDRWEDEPLPPRLSTLPAESRRVAGTRPEDWDRLFDQTDQPAQGDYIDAEVVTDPWAEIEA